MIGVAVVGAGHWGPNLIANFDRSGRSFVSWVVDADSERLAAIAQRYPSIQTSGELSEVLADNSVQAIVIATPTGSHFELARRSLEAGKHVLVEKPRGQSGDFGWNMLEQLVTN